MTVQNCITTSHCSQKQHRLQQPIEAIKPRILEGYYYKPRMDWDLFQQHSSGLIATTGCLGSVVQQALLKGDYKGALDALLAFKTFGRDNLFIELQDHEIPEQRRNNPQLLEIARALNAPLLATNDLHYTHQHDAISHDALLCVQTGSQMSDPDRFKFHGDQHYLKSAREMRDLFSELPESCDNTLWIAERADVNIEFETFTYLIFLSPRI